MLPMLSRSRIGASGVETRAVRAGIGTSVWALAPT
jgi:hypothetical protein